MKYNWLHWKNLKTDIFYWLQEIEKTNNLDILTADMYYEVIDKSKKAFGKCRYDFIELYKVDSFIRDNNLSIEKISTIHNNYQQLRNKQGSLKIIKDNKHIPTNYYSLSIKDKQIYNDYKQLNNLFNLTFFKGRSEEHKNIKNNVDKTDLIYIIIHHIREIENIKNNNGWFIPNLSDINIVLDKQYHKYQKRNDICRMDMFVHTFSHLIIGKLNGYCNLNLFKGIDILVKEKTKWYNGFIISENDFNNCWFRNYFTEYLEFRYMLNKYNLKELKLLSTAINILRDKLKD